MQKSGGPGGGPMGGANPFGPEALMKAMQNPKIAKHFEDPSFMTKINMCMQNPQMFIMMMQQDPRIGEVFQEMTGMNMQMFGGGGAGGPRGPMGGAGAPPGQEAEFEAAAREYEAE